MPGRHRLPSERSSSTPARVALTATAAAMVLQPMVPGTAFAATVVPRPSRTLPTATDVAATYQGQRSCDPAAKPGVEAYARLLLKTYPVGHSGGIVRGCGIGADSEHKEGRAFDFMLSVAVPAQKAAGDALTTWLTGKDAHGVLGGNARRLGVMYVIWNRHIWKAYTGRWTAYTGSSPHTDHVHTSFTWDGAEQRTSWWDGSVVTAEDKGTCRVYDGQPAPVYTARRTTPCPTNLPAAPRSAYSIVWPGQRASSVKVAQARLGVNADGDFGSVTRSHLMSWQRSTRVPVTGVLDKPTWARLVPATTAPKPPAAKPPAAKPPTPKPAPAAKPPTPKPAPVATTPLTAHKGTTLRQGSRGAAVVALQRALRITADGAFGPITARTVKAFQAGAHLRANGVVARSTWDALERAVYPPKSPAPKPAPKPAPTSAQTVAATTSVSAYKATVLRSGSRGASVRALQTALGMKGVDGAFGAVTARTVAAFQTAKRLPATGVVDRHTWDAVERVAHPLLGYRSTVLRVGSRGTSVKALQKALRITADGAFGPKTQAAVKSAQGKGRLARTGTVAVLTWITVEKQAYPLGAKRW